jgi:2-succinyl-5-enolpyruvyl-6-hydroxy-3-cyclohexene-1-carboxylate synthase
VAVLQGLRDAGVREVVLAPGSRSTPLALAAWAADRAGDLRVHVRIDERSAGFLALGLAMGGHAPVAVVTTSGTAVGNLLPAVMEAHHAGRPLVVVSADRPDHLRGTGANQTTDQVGLFGRFAATTDTRTSAPPSQVRETTAAVCRADAPVHLNLQLDGLLVPDPATPWWPVGGEDGADTGIPEDDDTAATRDRSRPTTLGRGPRTLVVAGDDAGPAARILAERAGWPLLAEPTSGARAGANAVRTARLLLGTSLRAGVERVVVVGHPTLSRPVTALISDPELEILAVRTRVGVATDPGRVAQVLDQVPRVDGDPEPDEERWLGRWRAADRALSAAIDAQVRSWQQDLPPGELHPLAVAAEIGAAVTPRATLVVGSSNPIRDLDVMATPFEPLGRRFVVANRGLAGIDGVVSTAIGVALARPSASRRLAVMGDLTFLHDANALRLGPDEPRPDLHLVVVNDDGGSIFSLLEQGGPDYAAAFERVFATPTGTDLAALVGATPGTTYRRVLDLPELRATLNRPARGIEVTEVRVPRGTRRADAAALAALAAAVVDGAGLDEGAP